MAEGGEIEKFREECIVNFNCTKKSIQDYTEKLIKKIKQDAARLVQKVDNKAKETLKELDIDKSNLCELQEGLHQRVEKCAKEAVMKHKRDYRYLSSFSANKSGVDTNLIGEVNFHLVDSSTVVTPVTSFNSPDVRPKESRKPADVVRKSPAQSFRKINTNLLRLNENTLKEARKWSLQECEFKLNYSCERFAYINNTLWCPSPDNNYRGYIDVYSIDGEWLDPIRSDIMQSAWSVHPQTDQHILVAAENGLFRMTTEGKEVNQVIAGHFRDVHVNNDIIAALEYVMDGEDKVHILDNTDPPSGHRHFTLEDTYSIRLLVTGEHVYVSFSKPEDISYISKYTVTGEKLCQYGKYGYQGPGQLQGPILCASDSQHSVVVADTHNDNLHVLDRDGEWRVIESIDISHPLDIVITSEGHMYILYSELGEYDSWKYKIKKFLFTENY